MRKIPVLGLYSVLNSNVLCIYQYRIDIKKIKALHKSVNYTFLKILL